MAPCGPILKLAWYYWGLAGDPGADVRVLGGLGRFLLFTLLPLLPVAMSVPKKKRRMKELNKKEAVGDLLDAFKEVSVVPGCLEATPCPVSSCDELCFVSLCLGR